MCDICIKWQIGHRHFLSIRRHGSAREGRGENSDHHGYKVSDGQDDGKPVNELTDRTCRGPIRIFDKGSYHQRESGQNGG